MGSSTVDIYPDPAYPAAKAIYDGREYPAVVAKHGVTQPADKVEGDGKLPIGEYSILGGYYRPDVMSAPVSDISFTPIEPDDIWVIDSSHPLYNQPAKISDIAKGVRHETLWRDDHLYDVFLDLDYNRSGPTASRGSAIFVHVARHRDEPSQLPTAGCLALKEGDLLNILGTLPADSSFVIHEKAA